MINPDNPNANPLFDTNYARITLEWEQNGIISRVHAEYSETGDYTIISGNAADGGEKRETLVSLDLNHNNSPLHSDVYVHTFPGHRISEGWTGLWDLVDHALESPIKSYTSDNSPTESSSI